MASPHRKLFPIDQPYSNSTSTSTSSSSTTVQTCLHFCDASQKSSPFCPQVCSAICPSLCQYYFLPEPFSLSPPLSPPLQPNKPHNLSPLFISMFTILASAFLLISFYVLYTKLYPHLFLSPRQTRPSSSRTTTYTPQGSSDLLGEEHRNTVVFHPIWYIPTVGLHPSVINSIKIHKYDPTGSLHVDGSYCAVCLVGFQEGDELRVLPTCNHAFHVPCVDTWLRSHINCPLCRAPVVRPPDPTPESSSPALGGVRAGAGDHNPLGEEEVRIHMTRSNSVDMNNKGTSLERGAASFVSRSLSCGAKVLSSS